MFKKDLGKILVGFSKVQAELSEFILEGEQKVLDLETELSDKKEDLVRAGKALENVNKIVGE